MGSDVLFPYTLPQWLPGRPECTLCDLSQDKRHPVGIRGVMVTSPGDLLPSAPLVVFLGQNPGLNECRQGVPFVGPVGTYFHGAYLNPSGLVGKAHIAVLNSYRCYHPTGISVKQTWVNACSHHLLVDLLELEEHHHTSPLFILAMGRWAAHGLSAINPNLPRVLRDAWSLQGSQVTLASTRPWTVFWTFHPGALKREHSYAPVVKDHLKLLVSTIEGSRRPIPKLNRVSPFKFEGP